MDKDQVRILSERTYYDGAVLSISGEVRNGLGNAIRLYHHSRRSTDISLAGLTFAGDSARVVVYRMAFRRRKDIGKVKETKL